MDRGDADAQRHIVVVNDEGQYALWPDGREPPHGWRAVTQAMTRSESLAYIERVWTDMRPRSLRHSMDGSG